MQEANINDPYAYTLDDKVTQLMNKLLSQLAPGVGQFITPLVKPLGYKMLGISPNDAMLESIVDTNQTPYGVFNLLQSNRIARGGGYAVKTITNAAKMNALRGISSTLVSEKAWAKLDPATRGASYKEYIENLATERSSNMVWNMLHGFIDPNGMNQAAPFLNNTATNMIRKGVGRGDRNSYIKATQVMKGLFTDDKGNYSFDSKEYGFMNQTDVAAVAANLSKDIDVLANTRGTSVTRKQLQSTIDKFKGMLKEYSSALAPLKTVFGGDIQSMLQTIESITGSSISALGASRVRNISNNIAHNLASGKYSADELFHVTNQFRTSMRNKPGVSRFNRGHAHLLAIDTLGAVNGGLMPVGTDKADFASFVAKTEQGLDSGGMAEIADLAYVAYVNNENKLAAEYKAKGKTYTPKTSISDFKQAIKERQVTPGTSTIAALYDIAGVKNQYELFQLKGSAIYRMVKELGVGRNIARDELYDMNKDSFVNSLSRSGYLRAMSKREGFAGHTETSDKQIINKTMKLLEADASLLSNELSDNDMLLALANKLKDPEAEKITSIEQLKKLGMKKDSLYDMTVRAKRTVEFLKNEDAYQGTYYSLIMRHNSIKSVEEANKAKKRMERVNKITTTGVASIKENISRILGLDTGKGFSVDVFNQIMKNRVGIEAADEGIDEEMRIAMKAAQDSFIKRDLSVKIAETKNPVTFGKSLYDEKTGKDVDATSTEVRQAYLNKALQAFDNKDKANDADAISFKSWFDNVYKKEKGNEKATLKIDKGSEQQQAITRAYADYIYKNDIKRMQQNSLNAMQFVLSDAGLNSAEYRRSMTRIVELRKKKATGLTEAEQKEHDSLTSYIEIARNMSSEALTKYLETDNGFKVSGKVRNSESIRKANIDRLVSLYNKNGISEVQHELNRSNMVKNIKSLKADKKLGAIATSLEQEFMASRKDVKFEDKTNLFSDKNLSLFTIAEYDKFVTEERDKSTKRAETLTKKIAEAEKLGIKDNNTKHVVYSELAKDKDGKSITRTYNLKQAREALQAAKDRASVASSVITQSNRSGQGLGSVLSSLVDALKQFTGTMKDFINMNDKAKAGGNASNVNNVKTAPKTGGK
jgi:hypothetical protein